MLHLLAPTNTNAFLPSAPGPRTIHPHLQENSFQPVNPLGCIGGLGYPSAWPTSPRYQASLIQPPALRKHPRFSGTSEGFPSRLASPPPRAPHARASLGAMSSDAQVLSRWLPRRVPRTAARVLAHRGCHATLLSLAAAPRNSRPAQQTKAKREPHSRSAGPLITQAVQHRRA